MARMFNAYQAQTPIGQGISNLAQAFFSGPSAHEQQLAQAEYDALTARTSASRASTQASRMDTALDADKLSAYRSLPEVFSGAMSGENPGASIRGSMPQLMSTLTRAGEASQIGDLILTMMANAGAGDPATARAMVGAGKPIGENQAVSLQDREYVRGRNAALDPKSESEVKGSLLGQMFDQLGGTGQRKVLGALPSKSEIEGQMLQGMELSPVEARTAVGAQPSRTQVEGAALEQAYPQMSARDQATIHGTRNAPSMEYQQTPGGRTVAVDKNEPNSIAEHVPIRRPAEGGGTQLRPTSLQGAPGTQDDGLTAQMKNHEAEAMRLGVDPRELAFIKRVDEWRRATQGMERLDPDAQAKYDEIMDKIRSRLPMGAGAGGAQ